MPGIIFHKDRGKRSGEKSMEKKMNSSARQGIFFIFIFVEIFTGSTFLGFSMFQNLLIIIFAAIVMKLTDIEEAIRNY